MIYRVYTPAVGGWLENYVFDSYDDAKSALTNTPIALGAKLQVSDDDGETWKDYE